jgi:DNA repair protein RadA/Sms
MARSRSQYACQSCGAQSPRWMGRCPGCGEFGTMVEERIPEAAGSRQSMPASRPTAIQAIAPEKVERIRTGIGELDRVLGGGVVPGSLTLIGGDPGIGKSTLLLQLASQVGQSRSVIYVTAEESLAQVSVRAQRLNALAPRLVVLAEDRLDQVEAALSEEPWALGIVDSLQTVYHPDLESAPGSVAQVREVASRLMRVAKGRMPLFLVGHVNKEGSMRPVA